MSLQFWGGRRKGALCVFPPTGRRGRTQPERLSTLEVVVVLDLTIEPEVFVDQLSQEIGTGGLTVVDATERLLGEHIENSIRQSLGGRLVKAPRSTVHPGYYLNRFENLATLAREGYSTWYPEVRFATGKGDSFKVTDVHFDGFELGNIVYGGGVKRQYVCKQKALTNQVNHIVRLNRLSIPSRLFKQVTRTVTRVGTIAQPYIANLTVGCRRFIDDRIEGFRTVAFDHVVTGERRFCRCHSDAHTVMISDAVGRMPSFVADSWPHHVVSLLEQVVYREGLCHFCVSEQHGGDAHLEWYGSQIREHYGSYVDLLIRSTHMDANTAKSEAQRRLSISRWVREDELYQLVTKLFPATIIRREASPLWLGQLRLDIFLPELGLAVEHQGEQHYRPIAVFGGDRGFERTRERDERKRALCYDNGVTVVDIRFDQSLTLPSLRHRLRRWLGK